MTGRQLLASLLAVAAVVLGLVGVVSLQVRDEVVARQPFAANALKALDRAPVRLAVEQEITTQVQRQVPDGVMSRAQIERIVDRVIDTRVFRRSFRRAAAEFNRVLFHADARGGDSAQLRLGEVIPAFDAIDPQLGAVLSASASQQLLTLQADTLGSATHRIADGADTLAGITPLLALVALAGALLIASDRRSVLRLLGIGALIAGVLLLGLLSIGQSLGLDRVEAGEGVSAAQARDAAAAIWDVYTDGLRPWAFGAIIGGLLITALTLVPLGREQRSV